MQYPMLSAQQNIEMMMFQYPETALCNMGGYFVLEQKEMVSRCRQMFELLPRAHGVLNLTFHAPGIFGFYERTVNVKIFECEEYERVDCFKRMEDWVMSPFAPERALFDVALFHFQDGTWYGCEKFHHLIIDKKAMLLLVEWQLQMLERLKNETPEDIMAQMVPDTRYLKKLEKGEHPCVTKEQVRKWLTDNFFRGKGEWLEHEVSLSAKADNLEISYSGELFDKIQQYAKDNHISVESLWYLVIATERCKRKGIRHGVLGRMTEYRGRNDRDVVGLYSRVVPVPYQLTDQETTGLCRQLEGQFLISLRYGEYPLSQLSQIEPDINIKFDTVISFHPQRMVMEENRGYWEADICCIDTPLRIWINSGETRHSLQLFYQTALYRSEEIRHLGQRYLWIMEQFVSGVSWDNISLLQEEDRSAYRMVNESANDVFPDRSFTRLLFQRMTEEDEKGRKTTILKDMENEWSCQDTLRVFLFLADWLRQQGISKGDVVAVCLPRSVWLPVVMLAILDCDASFLPIYCEESEKRKQKLSSGCSFVFDEEVLSRVRSEWECSEKKTWEDLCEIRVQKEQEIFDTEKEKETCAYCLYTSGSTGEPKAVQISRYSLLCRLQWMYETYGSGGNTLQKTINTFDVSNWELLLPLLYGGCLCMLLQGEEKKPNRILERIRQWQIETIHFVPSMLSVFVEEMKYVNDAPESLKRIFSSGEALSCELVQRVYERMPKVQLTNLYGPTECTIDVSYHECLRGEKAVPIGRAVANTQLLVLSEKGDECQPIGVAGELCVLGDLVGLGYLGGEPGGYCTYEGKRAYRTGDLVRLSVRGDIEYLGRKDRQTKLRGMRIDVGIVEKKLVEQPGITAAYVTVKNHALIAYYEAKEEVDGLREIFADDLPDYNIPSRWCRISHFPKHENGKTDVKKLVEMAEHTNVGCEQEAATDMEKYLLSLLKKYMDISVGDNILDAGLDSLTAIQIIQQIRNQGYDCSYSLIYQCPTVRLLAEALQSCHWRQGAVEYLGRHEGKKILICIPFGGGQSEIFGGLAKRLEKAEWDIGVVNMDYFQSQSFEQISEEIVTILKDYEKITVFGYCVGSGLAVALERCMRANQKQISHMFLMSSLPDTHLHIGKKYFSLWDLMGDEQVAKCLTRLNPALDSDLQTDGTDFYQRIPEFRRDASRFFTYMDWEKTRNITKSDVAVTLFFGTKDLLTFGYRWRYRKWRHFFAAPMEVVEFPGAGHYLLDTHFQQVCKRILETLKQI